MANTTNPFARTIIIQPKYLERTACKSRKNDSDMSEFNETTAVINEINNIEMEIFYEEISYKYCNYFWISYIS